MFYLLPCLGNRCCPQNEEVQAVAVEHKWTKLEVGGLLLDITLIVGLCLVASLTVCVHSGVPLGSLNALSVINIPALSALWGGAMVITIIDIVKGACCLDSKRPQLTLQHIQPELQTGEPDAEPQPTGGGRNDRKAKQKEGPQNSKRKEPEPSTNQDDGTPPTTQLQEPLPGTDDKTKLNNVPPILAEDQKPKPLVEKPAPAENEFPQPQPKQDPIPQIIENPLPNDQHQALPEPELQLVEKPAPAGNEGGKDDIPQPLLGPNLPALDPVPHKEPEPKPEPMQVLDLPKEQHQVPQLEPKEPDLAGQQPDLQGGDGAANPAIVPPLDQQPPQPEPAQIEKPPVIQVEIRQPLPEPAHKPQALDDLPEAQNQEPKPEPQKIEQPELPPQNNLPPPQADTFKAEAKQEPQPSGIDIKNPLNQSEDPQPLSHLQKSTPVRFLGEMIDPSRQPAKVPSNPPSPRLVLKTDSKDPLIPVERPQKSVQKHKEPQVENFEAVPVEDYDLEASIVLFMQPEMESSPDDLFGNSKIFDMDEPQVQVPPVPQEPSEIVEQPQGMWGHLGAVWKVGAQGLSFGVQGIKVVAGGVWDFASSFKKPGNVQTRFYQAQVEFIIKQFFGFDEKASKILRFQFKPFEGKIQYLRSKKFNDKKLCALQSKILEIIDTYKNDLPSMKYYLLCEIETAYFENRDANDKDGFREIKEYSEPLDVFLRKLCYELFAGFDAIQYGRTAMRSLLPKPSQPLNFGNIAQVVREDQKKVKSLKSEQVGTFLNDQQGRARGAVGVAFYPLLENNFANFLWEESYTNGHTVKVIRFGTPTSQDAVGNVSILGQMHAFMRECVSRNESLVCFEHQALEGADGARAKKMLNLANHVYPEHFYFIHSDMDSTFFKQKRVGIDIDTKGHGILQPINDFKAALAKHVFMLPKSDNLKTFNDASQNDLQVLADVVQRNRFNGKTQLTREERQDFIMEYYVEYRKYVHKTLKPTFSFDKCKDTQDRSMSILNLGYLNNQMELGKHEDPQTLEDFRVLCVFVGLIVKGSPMDHERFIRFISVVERWSTQQVPKVQTLLSNQVIKSSTDLEYTYKTLPCDAVTQEEYLDSDLLNKNDAVLVGVILKSDEDPHKRAKELISRIYANTEAKTTITMGGFKAEKAEVRVSVQTGPQKSVKFEGSCWIEDQTNKIYVQLTNRG